ncbi:phospholipid carrier-dependent glycosyltransferase [Naasia sp. SYSU D00057]|uniref:dolichyl-phosphate-mannose--protein mannosyltransferase n=1 Tax=Naasia sp. SYSU D00057 TaxID=2817380 RepID=UPI0027DDC6B4|nr:phospholipid carrier-dependent glycosyltransferase [Naasia sp. SYSU D00057]
MPSPIALSRRALRDLPVLAAVPRTPLARALDDRVWRWLGPLIVTLLAAVLRFWNLGHPPTLMFDETYYVKDAWTILNLGYEATWPEGSDEQFNAGIVDGYTTTGSYVAHPPLGKWLIAIGLAIFGPESTFGWRFSTALAGTLAVLLLVLIATTLFRSTLLGVLTGALFAVDGQAIVLSRISLLDNFVMLFALLGFGAVLLDRRSRDRRLEAWRAARGHELAVGWGPALAMRPWLLAAGVAFGLTCAVKWSGVYFLAAFGIYVVVSEALARRRAGVDGWLLASVVRQAPLAALWMLPAALAAYLASFTGWFLSSGGWGRSWIETGGGERWTGALAWVPDAVQNLWHWHADIYAFHTGLSTSHPYATPAILWPLLARPTQIHYIGSGMGENGCTASYCSEIVWSVANPLLWWTAIAATLYLVYRFVRYRHGRDALILTAVAAGYLPWLLYPTRTMFQFYTIAFEPYLLLALVAVLGGLTGLIGDPVSKNQRILATRLAGVFLVLVALLSAFFYPLWAGIQTPFWFWQIHVWLPSWV